MDYDKLIHCLKCCARVDAQNIGCDDCGLEYCGEECQQLCGTAATAISTLQAENEKLRAELSQMAACVYYKPGGLCRYGGDDPANVCVLGPCPHERTAEEVLADLARMTEERDAAVEDISSVLANAEEIRRGYGVDNADADAAFADLCGNYCAKCGNNCYKEAEDYRCKNFKWRGI